MANKSAIMESYIYYVLNARNMTGKAENRVEFTKQICKKGF